jgi:hypothetical protein
LGFQSEIQNPKSKTPGATGEGLGSPVPMPLDLQGKHGRAQAPTPDADPALLPNPKSKIKNPKSKRRVPLYAVNPFEEVIVSIEFVSLKLW